LEVHGQQTVKELKEIFIWKEYGSHIIQYRMKFRDRELLNHLKLSECNLFDGCTVNATFEENN